MPLWPTRARRDTAAAAELVLDRAMSAPTGAAAVIAADLAARSDRIGLRDALTVPAFARALALYRGVVSAFPLREYPGPGPVEPTWSTFLDQPDPDNATGWVIGQTVEDLVLHGRAFWWVTDSGWDGFPTAARWLPAADCQEVPGRDPRYDPPIGVAYGERVFPYAVGRSAKSSAGHAVAFRYGHGVLEHGGPMLTTAIALEAATRSYAESPVPQLALKNTGADLPDDEALALVESWEQARRERSTAYLSAAVELDSAGFNPEQLQMVDARNMAAVQVARAFNLDPVWVGASQSGSSITYANRVDLYRQLVDLSLGPVMAAIGQRLTMRDVTARGHVVRFDTSAFLRDDPAALSEYLSRVMPLGLSTVAEGRALLGLPPVDQVDGLDPEESPNA